MADAQPIAMPAGATGVLVLANGDVIWGRGFGAEGSAVGEVCFHTAMTGYQEVLTDPSFAGQMICFTFPHIGNVGANPDDVEADDPHALGIIVREDVTQPSSFRAVEGLDGWMKRHARIGLSGVDTRALTRRIRVAGAPNGVIAHSASGEFDVAALLAMARAWPGLEGMDLAKDVSTEMHYGWGEKAPGGTWRLGFGYDAPTDGAPKGYEGVTQDGSPPHVVAIDYGSKRNIFRNLVEAGAKVSVVSATATFDEVMALNPDGIFLSNGPGDPEPCDYAIAAIQEFLQADIPVFGICLGHQLLGLASGARTLKMKFGHHGANHPVQELAGGHVLITSQNHGFAVDEASLPARLKATHRSLFDGSLQGIARTDRPAFGFQGHPEASPGPHDVRPLFEHFVFLMVRRLQQMLRTQGALAEGAAAR
ncbi:MAG: glutamine-hydrolyzing carbamoyl-phosphate synthase small subunit [Rhizorhabdus sp.]